MKKILFIIALLISGLVLNAQSTIIDYESAYSLRFEVSDQETLECSVFCDVQPTEPTAITIPSTVTIEEMEFNVTSIGSYAFYGCSSLTNISFGEDSQLTSIGYEAFRDCSSLTSIEIPSGVTEIPGWIFENCESLKSIRLLAETVVSVGNNYLGNNIDALRQIQVPEELIESYKNTEPWSRYAITKIYPYHYGGSIVEEYEGYSLRFTADPLHEGAEVRLETAPENPTAITIPSTVTIEGMEFNVTFIGDDAFRGCSSLTSIEIPSGVTEIGNYVFAFVDEWGNPNGESNLESVTFGEDSQLTSIGSGAFSGCSSLASIEIPSGVTSIGGDAFNGCSSLTNISFGEDSQLTSIGYEAFRDCSSLTSIEIPSGVTYIGEYAFYGCSSLTGIEIPSGVTSIGEYAFSGCSSLTNISFGEDSQLTSIGSYAFYSCSRLTGIEIPSGVTEIPGRIFGNCTRLKYIRLLAETVVSVGDNYLNINTSCQIQVPEELIEPYKNTEPWFYYRITKIYPYFIGEELVVDYDGYSLKYTAMEDYRCSVKCYAQPSEPTSITIPTTVTFGETELEVTSIEGSAFNGCYSLTSIEIPSGVTSIGFEAFRDCSSLTSIEIPSGVTSIYGSAFYSCSRLTSVSFGENSQLTSIYSYAFYSCSRLTSIEIPSGVTSIGDNAFNGCSSLTSIEIPSGVTEIGSYAFAFVDEWGNPNGESNLESVTFGEDSQLTSIGDGVFRGCSSLTSIGIPSGVTFIGEGAFAGCPLLTNIEIPSGVTSIGDGVFNGCSSLTSIGIPSGVTSIGSGAFWDCSSLASIEIPSGVTSIGDNVFSFCSRLTRVTFGENSQLTSIGNEAFRDCSKLADIALPQALVTIGNDAFMGCSSLTGIEIPSGVTSIGSLAFWGCTSLISVNFAENSALTFVGGDAFVATSLRFVEFPATLKTLGANCLGGLRYMICNSVSKPATQGSLTNNDGELTIFVPGESVDAYKESFPWNEYEILPIDRASVTISKNEEEAGSVTGEGNYCKGMVIEVTATPNKGYDFVGWKEFGDLVSTDSRYEMTLQRDRNLEAVFELSKYWNPDIYLYPNDMNITAQVEVDDIPQNSTLLEVGAFCGDELRGSGRIQYVEGLDKYIVSLSVMGEAGDQIKFKLYDHNTGTELQHVSLSVLPFNVNDVVGTPNEPYLMEFSSTARITVVVNPADAGYVTGAGDYTVGSYVTLKAKANFPYLFENWTINGEVVSTWSTYSFVATESLNIKANFTSSQRTELKQGWNWTSFHTFIAGYNGLLALELSLGDYGLHIKNQNSFVTNYNGSWYGSLSSIDVRQMYVIRVSDDFTLVLNGLVVDPEWYRIELGRNWKWIGYPVSVEMPVAEALSGITPCVNDIIKTQGEFATYTEGLGWYGTLETMKPGKGYMYLNNSNTVKTLVYPEPSSRGLRTDNTKVEELHWNMDVTQYPNNMNMIAVLDVDGNEMKDNYEIAAFAGNELRGSTRPIYVEALDRYMIFLTVSGDETENLTFKYYDLTTEKEYDIAGNMMFSVNAVVGNMSEPHVFNASFDAKDDINCELMIYPNPANVGDELTLGATYDRVEVYNAVGAKVAEYDNVNKLPEFETAGVYLIKATIEDEVKYNKVIIK